MAQVYETFFFEIKIGFPTIWGEGSPVFHEQNSGNVLPLSLNGSLVGVYELLL